ncbi:Uma2 family endonuclease [Saccharothrix sp. DSM 118769]
MTGLPDWMRPPREEGWFAEDLDRLPEAPRHTELIDGALVLMMNAQRRTHGRIIRKLTNALEARVPANLVVDHEMTIRLDKHNRPEADVVVTTVPYPEERTWFTPAEVVLAVEVVSPESEYRDRTVKLRKYAEAGIAHHWRIEEEAGKPVVHVYELDTTTSRYALVGIFHDTLQCSAPFDIKIDLAALT